MDDEVKGMSREIGNDYNRIGPAEATLDNTFIAGNREVDDKTGSSCERKQSDSRFDDRFLNIIYWRSIILTPYSVKLKRFRSRLSSHVSPHFIVCLQEYFAPNII